MNFKRGRRKNARAGCLLCTPHKANGTPPRLQLRASDRRRLDAADAQLAGAGVHVAEGALHSLNPAGILGGCRDDLT